MRFLEKDLETIIWEANNEDLMQRGLPFYGKKFRQLRIGNYGVADLVTVYREEGILNITIYELKQQRVGVGAFLQIIGYASGIKSYLEDTRGYFNFNISIVLIGESLDTSGNLIYLPDLIFGGDFCIGVIKSVDFYTYKYEIDGLKFVSEKGYNLTERGF